jgi:hypothetical protein
MDSDYLYNALDVKEVDKILDTEFGYHAEGVLQLQEKVDTCSFDQAYVKTLHATETILRHEDGRQLRLQLLLVGVERNELRRELDVNDRRLFALGKQNLRIQQELKIALRNFEKADSDLQACQCENEALEVCGSFFVTQTLY